MAVGKQDVSLLFGVLGEGKIDGESGQLIKSQLASIIKSLNSKAEVKSRGVAINLSIQGTKKNFRDGIKTVLQGLDGNKQFQLKITEVDAKPALKSLKQQMQEMLNTLKIDNVKAAFDATNANGSVGGSSGSKETSKVKKDLTDINAKLKEIGASNSKITSQYKTVSSSLFGSGDSTKLAAAEALRNKYVELTEASLRLKENRNSATDAEVQNVYRLQQEIRELISLYTTSSNSAKELTSLQSKLATVQSAAQTALGYTKARHTTQYKEIVEANQAIHEMVIGLRQADSVTLDRLHATIKKNTTSIKNMGLAGKSMLSTFEQGAAKFASWFSVSTVIMKAVNALRQMLNIVVNIDTAMTELKKVTDETDVAYSRFLDRASERAEKLGATLSDTVNATADFARLGYNIDEASALADAALVYKNVGDGIEDISTASESVISTMTAFGIAAEDAMDIVNVFNEVGNNFAITSKGIGDALVRSASALSSANNSFEESVALIAGANSVIQDADKVGTTLKTISMFLRAAKTEAEEAGESTEGMADSVSELRSEVLALTGGRVDVMESDSSFKSTIQILREIAAVWDDISDVSQANLLEMLGGKRNANVVASVITNFEVVEEALISTGEAANSAVNENAKYMDSITGKVALFKTAVEELSVNLIDSEAPKAVIDIATGMVKIVNALVEINALLPITLGLATAFSATKSTAKVDEVFELFSNTVSTTASGNIRILGNNIESLKIGFDNLTASQQSAARAMIKSSLEAAGQADRYDDLVAALGLVRHGNTATVASNGALGASFKALSATLLKSPLFWVTIITSLWPVIENIIDKIHVSNEELIQDAKDLNEAYKDASDEIKDNLKTLHGLEDEFLRLSKGVGEYGENISLSTTDYERYQDIVQTIVGISPSLIEGYDAEGNAIANKNGLLEESIRLMEEEQLLRAKEQTSSKNNAIVGGGIVGEMSEHLENDPRKNIYGTELYEYFSDLQGVGQDSRNFRYALAPDADSQNGNLTSDFIANYYDQIVDTLETEQERLVESGVMTMTQIENLLNLLRNYDADIRAFDLETDRISKGYSSHLQIAAQATGVYNDLSDAQKAFLTNYANTKRVTENTTAQEFDAMVGDIQNITKLIASTPALQNTINLGMRLKTGTDENGESLTIREYSEQFRNFLKDVESFNEDTELVIKAAIDIPDIKKQILDAKDKVKGYLLDSISQAEIDNFIDNLTYDQIDLLYKVTAAPDSLTIDELKAAIVEAGIDWDKYVNVWDFTSMVDGISDIESAISGLTSAMDKLNGGTALTKKELAELALQYPELLKVQNLFADTTVENQKTMLDSVIGSYESEYDALIDAKISELEVSKEAIDAQIALEGQKREIVDNIHALSVNDKLNNEEDYNVLLNELHDLENKNFTEASNTNLDTNESMLNMMLKQAGSGVEKSESIWEEQGTLIAAAHASGLTKAGQAVGKYYTKLKNYLKTNSVVKFVSDSWKKIMYGEFDASADSGSDSAGSVGDISVGGVNLTSGVDDQITIDSKDVETFASEYEKIIEKRLEALEKAKTDTQSMIDNLESMKGLDLTALYGSYSSGPGGSKIEEYTADIDKYREAIERLSRVQIRKNALNTQLDATDDLREQIDIHNQLIGVYREEQEAQENLDNLRKNTIENGVVALRELGLEVEYNRELNQFYVKDLEKINELTADSKGKYDSLQEATNALREDTEDLVDTLTDLNEENQDGSESWTELGHAVNDSKVAIVDALKEIVVNASDAVDAIQNVQSVLQEAANEYAANDGFISVDTFQAIVELGPQYMQYLRDENGLLVINKENIEAVIRAKTEQLAVEQALTYVERLRQAMQEDSVENLEALLSATEDATDATWKLVYGELAALGLSEDQYTAALHNINAIRSLSENAAEGIGKVSAEMTDQLNDMQTAADDILGYVMDMIKHQVDEEIEGIEKMKDARKEYIDQQKDALDKAKEESDYQDDVAESVKKIANLRSRIAALELDDSRAAKNQKATLEEELAEEEKALADKQQEYSIEKQKESYDKMYEFYEDEKDKEIEALEDSISSQQKLYDKAIDYIENNWDTLYQELLDWNYEYGSSLQDDITDSWEKCLEAAKRYGSYTAALSGVKSDQEAIDNGSTSIIGQTGASDQGRMSNIETASYIVNRMLEEGSKWSSAATQAEKDNIHQKVHDIAQGLVNVGIVPEFNSSNGVWYIKSDSNNPSNAGKELIPTYKDVYHTGGIAGGGTLRENELLAVLEKGEPVISNDGKDALFELITFTNLLSKQLDMNNLMQGVERRTIMPYDNLQSTTGATNTVTFGDVYIYGSNEDTVNKHKEITRQFTNEILSILDIKQ